MLTISAGCLKCAIADVFSAALSKGEEICKDTLTPNYNVSLKKVYTLEKHG